MKPLQKIVAFFVVVFLLTGCGNDCHKRVKQECADFGGSTETCQEMAERTCE